LSSAELEFHVYSMMACSSEKNHSHFFGSVNRSSSGLMTFKYDGELPNALNESMSSNQSSTIPSVSPRFGPPGLSPEE
jgi:hypothetical protein